MDWGREASAPQGIWLLVRDLLEPHELHPSSFPHPKVTSALLPQYYFKDIPAVGGEGEMPLEMTCCDHKEPV